MYFFTVCESRKRNIPISEHFFWKMHRSSTKAGVHKPSYGAFLDVDVEKDKFISLRTLVS